ncbi:hypothetical protein Tco_0996507 [Tanacetum coccineum]
MTSLQATKTPPTDKVPMEDSDKTQPVSSGQTAHSQNTKGFIQPVVKRFHSPLEEGTRISKTKPLPEGANIEDKDSKRFKPLADMESYTPPVTDLSRTDAKYQFTQSEVSILDQHQSKTSSEVKLDTETLLLTTITDIQALLVDSEEELKDDSDDDVFEAGEEIDEDIQEHKTEETHTHQSTKELNS